MRKIILDTNFLMIPGRFRVDIFEELSRIVDFTFTPCVLEGSLQELQGIVQTGRKGEDKRAAKLALDLVQAKNLEVIEQVGNVDDNILDLAVKDGAVVATQDAELKRRLQERGIAIVVLRQRNHLELIGWVKR